jgi:YidC/Oxa1 family membrane protein insertase
MDKNTVLAIILSVIIIIVGFSIQAIFFAPEPSVQAEAVQPVQTPAGSTDTSVTTQLPVSSAAGPSDTSGSPGSITAVGDDPSLREFQFQTDVFDIVFDSESASISSIKLKKHLDNGIPVNMIFSDSPEDTAFKTYFGYDTATRTDYGYHVSRPDDYTIRFYRDFGIIGNDGQTLSDTFRLTKTFVFAPNDYLFELYIELKNSVNEVVPLNYSGYSYTLEFGPQIGPEFFEAPDGRYEYRRFYTLEEGKQKQAKLKNGELIVDSLFSWSALTGKYFTVIGIPDATKYTLRLSEGSTETIPLTSFMKFSRPAVNSSVNTDVFRFYIGPQQKQHLAIYNNAADNGFGLKDLQLEKAMDSSTWFGWLENVLKWLLGVFYMIIPNYGIAIILLTILIKVVLFPFTRKSFQSTARMQALNPQMQEIREKYKDNTAKMNQELSELYKREKVNPMGGCLPMLLQFPVFIALYGLLNKHFELRGAVFIPGWINDLSSPESIWNFSPVSIPFLGSDLRLLPILYVATMILSMKFSQAGAQSAGSGAGMNKMFTYLMPGMFFFILYNAPSGLILYWTVMNIFTVLQQEATNLIRKHKVEEEKANPTLKIVKPPSKKTGAGKPSQGKKKR